MSARRGRPRILHVIQNLNYGGMERLLADLVLRVDPHRLESEVLCLQYAGRFSEGIDPARVAVAPPMGSASMAWPRSLIRALQDLRPDVVHTHSGVWYKVSLAARAAGVPRLVHTEHGRRSPDPLSHRLVDGIAARRTDVVVAVSEPLRQTLIRRRIAPRDRVRVVRNGVDTARWAPRSAGEGPPPSVPGVPTDVPVIGSIGRLEPIKGYDVLVRALPRVRAPGSPLPHLVLAGEGSERTRLAALAAELGVGDRVHFLGWRNDTLALLHAFSVFAMSSHSEGTSVSLLEALSTGLCPVVTRVGGNEDVLGPALHHRLVPPGDPAALADALSGALRSPEARGRDGRAARTRVEAEYSLDAMVRGYEAIYLGSDR